MTDKIQYQGTVYVYNTGYPEELVQQSKKKLEEYGVNLSDIEVIEKPEGIPDGSILVTLWAHNLEVSKVRNARSGSIISTNLFNIEL
ncbi:MAG: hypothetical protein HMLIMOIP_000204 [Candidatus Nitrosomirales archaeon]|jgi:hypothetical protein